MRILSRHIALLVLAGVLSAFVVSAAEKIDINTALLEDLMKIVHIGESRAKELISLRPFSSLDDLTRIKGIGSSRVADIKAQGLAWVDESYKTETPAIEEKVFLDKGSAAVGKHLPQNSFFPLLATVLIALFSGIMILILKRKVKMS